MLASAKSFYPQINLMKKKITNNWTAKLAALVLAIAIWYLINLHLSDGIDFPSVQTEEGA